MTIFETVTTGLMYGAADETEDDVEEFDFAVSVTT
jgi:hypothetical protein